MKKNFALFILILFTPVLSAQNTGGAGTDSLFSAFINMRTPQQAGRYPRIESVDTTHIKCGFGIISSVLENYNNFTQAQKKILKPLLDRPVTDTSVVTPDGFFRIHYDLTGPNAPTYSIDSLEVILDSVYNFEINYLGYPPPPPDNGMGGDNKYDVYIQSLGNTYGYTLPENPTAPGSQTYTSYLTLDNDYTGFYTTGLNAVRVTCAHEFHHSIQIGNYIYRYNLDEFFYELTSTAMEHFVYPSVHDYYQYLPYYFNSTWSSLCQNGTLSEYALAIWNIFQKDKFGYGIIKKEWELMPQMRAIQAIASGLTDYGSSMGDALNTFGIWTYFTGYKAVPGQYFEDAADYPSVKPVTVLTMRTPVTAVQLSTDPVSNSFVTFVNQQNLDTLVAFVSNWDIQKGMDSTSALQPFAYNLYDQQQAGAEKLTDNYYAEFKAEHPAFWLTGEILNNRLLQSGQYVTPAIASAFPSPFLYNKYQYLYIPVQPDQSGNAQLNVYSAGMRLVFSTEGKVEYIYGRKVLRWNCRDNGNKKLASGVYIYVTKSGDTINKGKVVIFDE